MHIEEIVSTKIRSQSIIGIGNNYPLDWANYFWLNTNPTASRVVNFWAENLTRADLEFKLNGKVKIRRYFSNDYDFCLIDDDRIPKNWYYNKLCFTGTTLPPIDVARDMYEYLGDDGYEFEQFIDPVIYYAKRNQTYNPKTGSLTYNRVIVKESQSTQKVENSWDELDATYFFAPYIPISKDTK